MKCKEHPMSRKYLYGVIGAQEPVTFGVSGFPPDSKPVYTVVHQGLAGVVSDYGGPDFASLAREEQLRCLMAHQEVIERVMEKGHAILPIKFGTLVQGDDAVGCILQQEHSRLGQALEQMDGKVEMEVVAIWDLKRVLNDIGRSDEIAHIRESIASRPTTETLEQRIRAGKLVKESLDGRREKFRVRIVESFAGIALRAQPNALLADEMVANVAFLIPRERQGDFDQGLRELDSAFHDEVNFRVIGPLPPYSFSTVVVAKPSADKVEGARQLLRLGNTASEAEVQEAYRRLAAQHHPDVHPGDDLAEERFAQVRQAFVLLQDYCRGQRRGKADSANGQRYSLLPEDVSQAFLVDIGRPALLHG